MKIEELFDTLEQEIQNDLFELYKEILDEIDITFEKVCVELTGKL